MRKISHKSKNQLSLSVGRVDQKKRTRQLLLDAANQLLSEGIVFNIDDVAQRAQISTATAYRYFSNPETLKQEAILAINTKDPEEIFANFKSASLADRLSEAIDYHINMTQTNEDKFRIFLSTSLQESIKSPKTKLRGARRIPIIKKALEPFQNEISTDQYEHLVNALSVLMGLESYLVLKDICGLNPEQIRETTHWAIHNLIQSVLNNKG